MKSTCKCRCCEKLAEWEYFSSQWGMEEEHIKCECGYYYEFAYGFYLEKKPNEFAYTWSYLDHEKKIYGEPPLGG